MNTTEEHKSQGTI